MGLFAAVGAAIGVGKEIAGALGGKGKSKKKAAPPPDHSIGQALAGKSEGAKNKEKSVLIAVSEKNAPTVAKLAQALDTNG